MRERTAVAALILAILVAACGEDVVLEEPNSTLNSTTISTTSTAVTTPSCGDRFPIFYPGLDPVEGLPGPGPQGSPPGDGQQARYWIDESLGLTIEARWPAAPLAFAATPEEDPILHIDDIADGVRMVLAIPGPAGCGLLDVEVLAGEQPDAVQDFARSFAADIRPIEELDDYLNPLPPDPILVPVRESILVVEEFLESAGTGAWEIAAGLLINEGMAPEVENALGGGLGGEAPIADLLETYCAAALCAAPYEIFAADQSDGLVTVTVRFESDAGPVEWQVRVGQFEGILTLGDVPPSGSGPGRASLTQRIFGEERGVVIWYDAVQIAGPSSPEDQWARWWTARFGYADVLNRWGLSSYPNASINIEDLLGEFEGERLQLDDIWFVGSGVFDGREVAYLAGDDDLFELDIASLDVEPIIVPSDNEGFFGPVDAVDGTLAVMVGVGDSLWAEFYDRDLELISSTRDGGATYTSVALSPDGSVAAVGLETELHTPRHVALVDVASGRQLDSWSGPPDGVIGDVDFDGAFIVAPVSYPGGSLPEVLVIDAVSGETRLIPTAAHIDLS